MIITHQSHNYNLIFQLENLVKKGPVLILRTPSKNVRLLGSGLVNGLSAGVSLQKIDGFFFCVVRVAMQFLLWLARSC